MTKDFDSVKEEFENLKKEVLKEFRVKRPSDIAKGGPLSHSDYGALISTIKKRITKGEKRRKVVKDELLSFWKKKKLKGSTKTALRNVKNNPIYETDMISEGGNIFDNSGDIHKSEVAPTLKGVGDKLKIDNLENSTTGSAGKKEFSGDVDVVVPIDENDEEAIKEFTLKVKTVFGPENVKANKRMVSVLAQIQNYNEVLGGDRNRTGFIQIDFLFGDKEWLQTFYHSPGDGESTLKGSHRNVAISSIASQVNREESDERDDFDRPVSVIRWKWSPTQGLLKIERKAHRNARTDRWVKTRKDIPTGESYRKPEDIVKILFNGEVGTDALNSVESLIDAVHKVYDPQVAETIFKRMADGFKRVSRGAEFDYPPEIERHME